MLQAGKKKYGLALPSIRLPFHNIAEKEQLDSFVFRIKFQLCYFCLDFESLFPITVGWVTNLRNISQYSKCFYISITLACIRPTFSLYSALFGLCICVTKGLPMNIH